MAFKDDFFGETFGVLNVRDRDRGGGGEIIDLDPCPKKRFLLLPYGWLLVIGLNRLGASIYLAFVIIFVIIISIFFLLDWVHPSAWPRC